MWQTLLTPHLQLLCVSRHAAIHHQDQKEKKKKKKRKPNKKKSQRTSLSLMVFEPAGEYMLSLDYSVTATDRLHVLLPMFIYSLAQPVATWYLQ